MIRVTERCVGCGACMPFCPKEAISVMGVAKVDAGRCTLCGRCASYCPNQAIEVER